MARKKPFRPTFADVVAAVPESTTPIETFSYAVPHNWITVDGCRWHLRGDRSYEGGELHKMLCRKELPAFHEYMGKRTALAVEERDAFWRRAVDLMESSEYAAFVGYEYKSPDDGYCLVVYEFC